MYKAGCTALEDYLTGRLSAVMMGQKQYAVSRLSSCNVGVLLFT